MRTNQPNSEFNAKNSQKHVNRLDRSRLFFGFGATKLPDHPYHVPEGYSAPDHLPPGHPGEAYPAMPDDPVVHPGDWGDDWPSYPGILDDWPPTYEDDEE